MRHDPIAEGGRWLEQARHDLYWAEDLARRGGHHIACFLAQQVAEKALKAFLYATGEEVVLGHSVQRLGAAAAVVDSDFERQLRRWTALDGYYVPTRYPNGLPDSIPALVYTETASRDAVAVAREVVEFVASKIDGLAKAETG